MAALAQAERNILSRKFTVLVKALEVEDMFRKYFIDTPGVLVKRRPLLIELFKNFLAEVEALKLV